jgi:hypothetical protein
MKLLKAGRPTSNKKDKAIDSVVKANENYTKISLSILKSFHKQVKQRALDDDMTVTELVNRALEEYLNK